MLYGRIESLPLNPRDSFLKFGVKVCCIVSDSRKANYSSSPDIIVLDFRGRYVEFFREASEDRFYYSPFLL
jgi:hypothetical protein